MDIYNIFSSLIVTNSFHLCLKLISFCLFVFFFFLQKFSTLLPGISRSRLNINCKIKPIVWRNTTTTGYITITNTSIVGYRKTQLKGNGCVWV